MMAAATPHSGRHWLQIPGPTNVPDRVLRAMSGPVIDHRGAEFQKLGREILERIRPVFGTAERVVIFPSSGTGACEAALINTLSPGDHVLIAETGWFSQVAWRAPAERLGFQVEYLAGSCRRGALPEAIEARLGADRGRTIRAVVIVHNETSSGVTCRIAEIRRALNRTGHPALLIVDAISSVGSIPYHHDEWEVDVTVCASQKGLMLPPGLGFNAISKKALDATKLASSPRSYFDWRGMLEFNAEGFFPYTPATTLLYGLKEALQMLHEEGVANVYSRHARYGAATRAAVAAWGLELTCEDPREHSNAVTAVMVPDGYRADSVRTVALRAFDMSLGTGLGKLTGKVFRIGHLGWFNDLMLAGTLSGVEMSLRLAAIPHRPGGITAALQSLSATALDDAAVA